MQVLFPIKTSNNALVPYSKSFSEQFLEKAMKNKLLSPYIYSRSDQLSFASLIKHDSLLGSHDISYHLIEQFRASTADDSHKKTQSLNYQLTSFQYPPKKVLRHTGQDNSLKKTLTPQTPIQYKSFPRIVNLPNTRPIIQQESLATYDLKQDFSSFNQDNSERSLSTLSKHSSEKLEQDLNLPTLTLSIDPVNTTQPLDIKGCQHLLLQFIYRFSGSELILKIKSLDIFDDVFIRKLRNIKQKNGLHMAFCISVDAYEPIQNFSKHQEEYADLIACLKNSPFQIYGELNSLLPCLNDRSLPSFLALFKRIGIESMSYQLASVSREHWNSFLNWLTKNYTYKEVLIRNLFNDSLKQEREVLEIDEQYKTILDCRFKANCKKLSISALSRLVSTFVPMHDANNNQLALL